MAQQKEIELVYEYINKMKIQPGEGVSLGCGPIEQRSEDNEDKQVYPEILVGVDKYIQTRPDICADVIDLPFIVNQRFRLVYAGHVLEDLKNPIKALKEWFRILKIGGTMIVICPDEDYYPKVGTKGKMLNDKWVETNPGHQFNVSIKVLHNLVMKAMGNELKILEEKTLENKWSLAIVARRMR